MIPPQFDYLAPASIEEAVAALGDGDVKVLAGGQSLLPILRLRMAFPVSLVDLGRTAGMAGIQDEPEALVIGAMTSHYQVMNSKLVQQHCGLLAQAASTVADPQVRHRGTLGGALCHADPAGDLPAVVLACDATLVVEGTEGRRTIPASQFFVDYMQTALRPNELLVEIRLPKLDSLWGYHYEKFQRVAQAWAVVAVAALVRRGNDDRIAEARIGLANMGPTPVRASATEQALVGADTTGEAMRHAAARAAEGTHAPSDLSGQSDYRQHLARVLTSRAVEAAGGIGWTSGQADPGTPN